MTQSTLHYQFEAFWSALATKSITMRICRMCKLQTMLHASLSQGKKESNQACQIDPSPIIHHTSTKACSKSCASPTFFHKYTHVLPFQSKVVRPRGTSKRKRLLREMRFENLILATSCLHFQNEHPAKTHFTSTMHRKRHNLLDPDRILDKKICC